MKIVFSVVLVTITLLLFIDIVSRRRNSARRKKKWYPPRGRETQDDIERLIRAERKIEAIKAYRSLHNVDLKTAKEAVDRLSDEMKRSRHT